MLRIEQLIPRVRRAAAAFGRVRTPSSVAAVVARVVVPEVTMSLSGKHGLVTGSSRGIGRGVALKLAAEGAAVGITYYQNEAAARDVLAKVRELGSDGF